MSALGQQPDVEVGKLRAEAIGVLDLAGQAGVAVAVLPLHPQAVGKALAPPRQGSGKNIAVRQTLQGHHAPTTGIDDLNRPRGRQQCADHDLAIDLVHAKAREGVGMTRLHQARDIVRGKQRGVDASGGLAGVRVRLWGRSFVHVPSRTAWRRVAVVISPNPDTNDACCGARSTLARSTANPGASCRRFRPDDGDSGR